MEPSAEHLTTDTIQRYQRRTLTGAERLALDDHLATCDACRGQLARGGDLVSAFTMLSVAPVAAPAHLSYEELAAYVDETLAAAERVRLQQHLDQCAPCAAELQDLLALKAHLAAPAAPAVERSTAPATSEQTAAVAPERTAPPATVEAAPRVVSPPWYAGVRALFRWPSMWAPLPAMAASAAVVALVLNAERGSLHTQLAARDATLQTRQTELSAAVAQAQSTAAERDQLMGQLTEVRTRASTLQKRSGELQARVQAERQQRQVAERRLFALQQHPLDTGGFGVPAGTALRDGPNGFIVARRGAFARVTQSEPVPPEVAAVLKAQRVARAPALASLTGPAPATRGGGIPFRALTPVGTRVRTTEPTFRWARVPDATRYELQLTDETSGETLPPFPITGDTRWTPPSPLERGHRYRWEVRAYRDDRLLGAAPRHPAAIARFQVLGEAESAALERALAQNASSPLTKGVFYARAGLLTEAQREFQELLRANPDSATARKLLESVQTQYTDRAP